MRHENQTLNDKIKEIERDYKLDRNVYKCINRLCKLLKINQ